MISVVVPTLNEEEFIGDCLRSIRAQSLLSELIVIDGGSSDRTVEIATAIADKVYTLNSRGISNARDYGTRIAQGDIIVSVDADAVYQDNWLETLVKPFDDPEVVAVGGRIEPMKPTFLTGIFAKSLTSMALNRKLFVGSNMAFRKSAFLEVGGYNTNQSGGEDWGLSESLYPFGKLVFEPDAVGIVDVSTDRQAQILLALGISAVALILMGTFK